jgi:hypothetical protein
LRQVHRIEMRAMFDRFLPKKKRQLLKSNFLNSLKNHSVSANLYQLRRADR